MLWELELACLYNGPEWGGHEGYRCCVLTGVAAAGILSFLPVSMNQGRLRVARAILPTARLLPARMGSALETLAPPTPAPFQSRYRNKRYRPGCLNYEMVEEMRPEFIAPSLPGRMALG